SSNSRSSFACDNALHTADLRPGAPGNDAITTIESDNIIVWLIPCSVVGMEIGICTFINFCHVVEPKASAASTNSASTCLIPKFVNRTVGDIEKITVETTTGTI